MTLRFKPGDNVELDPNVFHSQSVDRILVRSGLLPLELGEGFKNDLTITSHAGISSRYDYTASITIDRLLPYPRCQQCDIYVDDSELIPTHPILSSAKVSNTNMHGATLSFNSAGQPAYNGPKTAYKFKPGEYVVLDPGADIDEICRRSGIVGLKKDDITEIKIDRIAAHTMLGVPNGVDYEATIKISTNHWLFHVYLMESEINYTVSVSNRDFKVGDKVKCISAYRGLKSGGTIICVTNNGTGDYRVEWPDGGNMFYYKGDELELESVSDTPKASRVCTHPKKYLNVISPRLQFWSCPDCKKEIE